MSKKPLIVIATSRVDEEGIWRNGLYQNIYLFCRLFKLIGYDTELFVNNPNEHTTSRLASRFTTFDVKRLGTDGALRIHSLLEIGMNCGDQVRDLFRMHGAKIIKVYLGNILNIDTEVPMFMPGSDFCHHLSGRIDDVWLSPHYMANAEYARVISRCPKQPRVAPYVWDPCFITRDGALAPKWSSGARGFTIIEPNISFQKCSFIPLMILEAYYRTHPREFGRVALVNGDKLIANPYFKDTIMPRLQIVKEGLVDFLPRMNIHDIVTAYPSNIVIAHQITNELNYIALEHLYMDFPYVHNSECFKDAGYYYGKNSIPEGVAALEKAVCHMENLAEYRKQAAAVIHKYSIHNKYNRKTWSELFNSLT